MTRSALKMAVVSLAALLAACSDAPQGPSQADIDKAIDDKVAALPPKPVAAHVVSFAVAPTSIKKGESATLTWAVENATAVAIKDSDGKAIAGVDAAALSGTVSVSPTATTTYLLEATGEGGKDFALGRVTVAADAVVTVPPAPLLFAAVPTEIDAGQAAYLVWNSAENVLVTDDANAELSATTRSGSLAVKPLKDTTYTAKTNTTPAQTVTATVKVNASIADFSADKAGAAAGDTVKFHWATAGATEVKLSERTRGLVYTAKNAAEASDFTYTDTLPAGLPDGTVLVFSLTAKNANGTRTANLTLTVSSKPTITEFKGPAVLTRAGTRKPTLSWKTTGGKALELYSGAKGSTPNTLEYRALSTAITTGSVELPLPAADTDYLLVVTSDLGAQATKTLSLKLVAAPVITTFTVNGQASANVDNGGDSVTLGWATTGGTELAISDKSGGTVYATRTASQLTSGTTTARPGAETEYVITVTNEAGDSVTKTVKVTVTNPLKITFNPNPALAGGDVGMSWDFSTVTGIQGVVGAPVGQTYPQGGVATADFIELTTDTAAQVLTDISNTTTTSKQQSLKFPDGFKFRHFGQVYDNAGICESGFIVFDSTATTCSSRPSTTVPSTSSPNNWVGPWAYDALRDGTVLYRLFGTAPTRTLVIQWDNFDRSGATPRAKISFELVLYETGQVDFLYKDMQGTSCTGTGCSLVMGMENQDGSIGFKSSYTVAPGGAGTGTQGDIITFNGLQPPTTTTPVVVKADAGATYELNLLVGTGSIAVRGAPNVIKAGDVAITEVMYKPVASATKGQWIELQNRSTFDIDLANVTFDMGAVTGVTLTGALPAGAMRVVGQSNVRSENGDTPVDFVAPTLALGASNDTITVKYSGTTLSSFAYSDTSVPVTAGTSITTADASWVKAGGGSAYCSASTAYGTAGSKGSPGTASPDKCGLFNVSSAAATYGDISANGTVLFTADGGTSPGTSNSRLLRRLTFPAGFTFPFDGTTQTKAYVSGCGYLTFDPAITAETDNDSNCNNPTTFPTTVTSSTLKGVLAVYWENLWYVSTTISTKPQVITALQGSVAAGDATLIIQWTHNAEYGGSTGSTNPTDANFQIWLHQNGDVEYHYGTLYPNTGATDAYMQGTAMSVGIVNMTGDFGHVFSHNEQKLSPNLGIRWTKQ